MGRGWHSLSRAYLARVALNVCVVLRGGFAINHCDAIDDGAIDPGLKLVDCVCCWLPFNRLLGTTRPMGPGV